MPELPRVLVADDQPDVVDALRLLLKAEGFAVTAVSSPAGVLAALEASDVDVVLSDLNYTRDTTSGHEGLDLLTSIRERDETLSVVVMTAWASVDVAVDAMRRGAKDFVGKPWDNHRLVTILRTQAELTRALRRSRRLESENRALAGEPSTTPIVAQSAAMQRILDVIARIAPSDANVLLLGENGVGKGTIARALHAASSRRPRPLVTVNVGGLSEGVFESELFGHVKGAFTDARADRLGRFDLADGGTLFLDEIANIPMALQAKLLRVVESGEFEPVGSSRTKRADARLISATNVDIDREIAAGRFREDLLFRLNTIEIRIPPLRERRDDIPALAQRFLEVHAQRYRKTLKGIDASAMQALRRALVAGQRPRARAHRRARGAADGRPHHPPGRPGAAGAHRSAHAARRHEPRGCRGLPREEGPRAIRREREPCGRCARPLPQRAVSTDGAVRALDAHLPRRQDLRAGAGGRHPRRGRLAVAARAPRLESTRSDHARRRDRRCLDSAARSSRDEPWSGRCRRSPTCCRRCARKTTRSGPGPDGAATRSETWPTN